jgi:predicted transglutaminase-like cysteine proteinase
MLTILSFSAISSEIPPNYVELQRVAQEHHVYISDQEQYGVNDKWVVSLKGDCEDYALFIQSVIGGNLAFVRTKNGIMHTVLVKGDYVFDNLSPVVYLRGDVQYKMVAEVVPIN